MTLLTVDLDKPNPVRILKAWSVIVSHSAKVKGRVSSSGEGVHIVGRADVGWDECLHIRRMAGDDPYRIYLDSLYEHKPRQILFDSKGPRKAGPWHDDPFGLVDDYMVRAGWIWD